MGSETKRSSVRAAAFAALLVALAWQPIFGQTDQPEADYVVGSQDVLTIASYDQADLTGKFTVETDGTFTFPLIGRFRAGGLTLRKLEEVIKGRLKDDGYFKNPQITVSVEQYRSQKVFIIG